jgi:hypothetical protein
MMFLPDVASVPAINCTPSVLAPYSNRLSVAVDLGPLA